MKKRMQRVSRPLDRCRESLPAWSQACHLLDDRHRKQSGISSLEACCWWQQLTVTAVTSRVPAVPGCSSVPLVQVRDRLTALHNACSALRSTATTKAAQNKVTKALEKLSKTAAQPLKDGQPAEDPAGPSQLAAQAVGSQGCSVPPAGQVLEEAVAMEVDCPEGEAYRSSTLAPAQVGLAQAWHSGLVSGAAVWCCYVRASC